MADRRIHSGDDLGVLLRASQDGWQTSIWTALPGIVQSFDSLKMTCTVQPALQVTVRDALGNTTWVTLPLLVDCPVTFPSAGGFSLTFPVQKGDEALVIFASRCIDSWWQSGGIQVQAELRMHDLSDGFVIIGPRSQPRVLPGGVDLNQVQLRSDDGLAAVSIDRSSQRVTVQTPGNVFVQADQIIAVAAVSAAIEAPLVAITGNVTVSGTVTAFDFITNPGGLGFTEHIHSGVRGGPDLTGPIVPGT